MKIDVIPIAKEKLPVILEEDFSCIWISKKEDLLFFGNPYKLTIYDLINKKKHDIEVDFDYIEALTTTEKYICFSEFGGELLLYTLKDFQFVKQLDDRFAMNWGGASYKDFIFISEEEDIDQFHLLDVMSEKFIKTYIYPNKWMEGYFLSGISCDERFVVGLIENAEEGGTIYPYWEVDSAEYVHEYNTEFEDVSDPLLRQNILAVENKIYDLAKRDKKAQISLEDSERIIYFSELFIFTIDDDYNAENDIKKIEVYSMRDGEKIETVEIEVDEFYTFKNSSKYFLAKLKNEFFLVDFNDLISQEV